MKLYYFPETNKEPVQAGDEFVTVAGTWYPVPSHWFGQTLPRGFNVRRPLNPDRLGELEAALRSILEAPADTDGTLSMRMRLIAKEVLNAAEKLGETPKP